MPRNVYDTCNVNGLSQDVTRSFNGHPPVSEVTSIL